MFFTSNHLRPALLLLATFTWTVLASAQQYVLLGWNDLGMHCANKGFSKIAVLPPFNNVTAQLLLKTPGLPPVVVDSGFTIEYSIPNNTYSVGKTDFWTYAQQLFGLPNPLPPNIGLTGKGLTGILDSSGTYFSARGIPLTPFPDSDLVNESPFQLIHLVAKKTSSGTIVATTDAVIPVSNEVGCVQSGCHTSETEILNEHESVQNFNRSGPVLCASCHASNALGTTGIPEAMPFSYRIHSVHAGVAGPSNTTATCYKCHPGPKTQCLRDVMGKNPTNPLICENCHGSMDSVASSVLSGRRPWLDEPKCGSCHGSNYAEQPGKLFRQSTGHGGLFCSACHGSPHAIQPTVQANDNLQNIRLQGYAGALRKCSVCHASPPNGPGPHGIMDTVSTPLAPVLALPANADTAQVPTLALSWYAAAGAAGYRLQVATDNGFTSLILDDSAIATTSRTVGPLNTGTTYYWHVNAANPSGAGPWSATWNFTTITGPPSAPILSTPLNGAVNQMKNLTLLWNIPRGAESYRIQVSTNSSFNPTILDDSTLTVPEVSLSHLSDTTAYFWHVAAENILGTSTWSESWSFQTGTAETYFCSMSDSWNLVSLPVVPVDPAKDALFPTSVSRLFAYNAGGGYTLQDTMNPGTGYWLKFRDTQTVALTGTPITLDTINALAGWNLVGSLADSLSVSSVVSVPPSIITTRFFGYENGYTFASMMIPGKGYWVKTSAPGKIILSGPGMAKTVLISDHGVPEQFDRISFTDAAGKTATLYLAEYTQLHGQDFSFELPPAPPPGVFDVRFTTNMYAESYSGTSPLPAIEVSSAELPVVVSWNIHSANRSLTLQVGSMEIPIEATGSSVVKSSNPSFSANLRNGSPYPSEYALEQNYPNPFNPSTILRYQLPAASHVTITVFDILGQRMEILVNEVEDAGTKSVRWSAPGLASGIYFYRIDAVNLEKPATIFSQVRKMMIIR